MCKIKDGFNFCAITYPLVNEDAIQVIVNKHKQKSYIDYINANAIEKAYVSMPNLEFLKKCPSLKYLFVEPSYNALDCFDFSPLYEMDEIKYLICENIYGENHDLLGEIDCSRIKGVESLSVSFNKGILNLDNIPTLKSLSIRDFTNKNKDLIGLFNSKVLDTLELNECKEKSLKGIEVSENLQCLYINYNRSLNDISALVEVKDTLKALCIDKCSKIEDFSVLYELKNLEYLELSGSNTLSDLKFLNNMKHLKTFIFDYNILDGDLRYCLNVPNVYCDRAYKHYNLKNSELPKGKLVQGNENIDEWRRIE